MNKTIESYKIQPDDDCCEVWPKIMSRFDWMVFAEDNRVACTPHICYGKYKLFVNYCPSCGKPARNRMVLASRLRMEA